MSNVVGCRQIAVIGIAIVLAVVVIVGIDMWGPLR